jgi:hypothetical protein
MSDNGHASATGGIGLVTVILALIFLFVWPGPLRYEYRDYEYRDSVHRDGSHTLLKIDRITHGFWVYNGGKWEKQSE